MSIVHRVSMTVRLLYTAGYLNMTYRLLYTVLQFYVVVITCSDVCITVYLYRTVKHIVYIQCYSSTCSDYVQGCLYNGINVDTKSSLKATNTQIIDDMYTHAKQTYIHSACMQTYLHANILTCKHTRMLCPYNEVVCVQVFVRSCFSSDISITEINK